MAVYDYIAMRGILYNFSQLCLIVLGFLAMHVTGGGKVPFTREGLGLSAVCFAVAGVIFVFSVRAFSAQRTMKAVEMLACLAVGFLGSAIVTPVFIGARAAATSTTCLSNAKQLNESLVMYTNDHDDRLPASDNWQQAGVAYKCPSAESAYCYGMNSHLSRANVPAIADLDNAVLIFECASDSPNFQGGRERFVPRHGGLGSVGLAGGFAKRIKPSDGTYQWKPELAQHE